VGLPCGIDEDHAGGHYFGAAEDAAGSDAIFSLAYAFWNSRQPDCYGERRESDSKRLKGKT
jgi:hypothetical protein